MMVALLLYGHAIGERSSRRIEPALRRGRRRARDLRQPGAGSHDDRAVPSAPRSGDGRVVRRRACPVRAGRTGPRQCRRGGRDQGGPTRPQATRDYAQIAREILAEANAVDAAEMSSSATLAATNCRPSWPRHKVGAGGCERPSVAWTSSAPSRRAAGPARPPRSAPRGQAPPGKSTGSSARPTRLMRPTGPTASTEAARSSAARRSRFPRRHSRREDQPQ
jgi:hypothetical protein